MEEETSFIRRNGNGDSDNSDETAEATIARGRPSRKMRISGKLSRSLRRRSASIAPIDNPDNSELFANTYGTFNPATSAQSRHVIRGLALSSSGEDHVMTIDAHRFQQKYSIHQRTMMKWAAFKERTEERMQFFGVSKSIECYGGGVFSYFSFVVWLGRVNFVTMLFYIGALLLPYALVLPHENFADTIAFASGANYTFVNKCSIEYDNNLKNYTNQRGGDVVNVVLDILQGTGVMEEFRFLFIGQFFDKILYKPSFIEVQYNTALAFFLCLWITLFAILLVTVISSGKRVLKRIHAHSDEETRHTFKTLARWDYIVRHRHQAKIEHRNIARQMKKDLDEDKRKIQKELMSHSERQTLICKRVIVWIVYIIFTIASFVGIYFVISFSTNATNPDNPSNLKDSPSYVLLILQYLPSIYIVVANFVIELYCSLIVNREEYNPNTAISITIIRTIILRFVSLVVLMGSMFNLLNKCHSGSNVNTSVCVTASCTSLTCWETYVGQQIYKLAFLDALLFLGLCLLDLFRKFLCRFIKFDVSTEFDIPKNVIDLIYSQTLCWLGMFFCPLLPVAAFIKIVVVYFFKKMCIVLHIYKQNENVSNAVQTDSYFLDTLLISLIFIVILPLGIATSLFQPSRGCGPYRLYSSSSDSYTALDYTLTQAFSRLGSEAQAFYTAIDSYVVVTPIWIFLILTIYYFITLSRARGNLNKHLQLQMVHEMQDQAFQQKRALESLRALKIAQAAQNR